MVQVGPPIAAPSREETYAAPVAEPQRSFVFRPRRRRYSVDIPVSPILLPFLGLMLVALGLRLWDLGYKALHHDESLHAYYSWLLYQGQGYVHDPMMHGPLLFILNAGVYWIFGASDYTARLMPAMLGVALVGMPYLLRRELGFWGAISASALFTISPTFLYFSRFLRHDVYVDVFTVMMVIGIFRYLATGAKRWFYTIIVGATLLFATKEDFYISGFMLFAFLAACWFVLRGERRVAYRARVRELGWQPWAIGAVIFLVVNLVLFTTFFTNMRGVCTAFIAPPVGFCSGATGALQYWFAQQDYARGGQPWFYYLMLLPLYEFLPLAIAGVGLFMTRGKNLFYWFCITWFVLALCIYSWAGEKMPWMLPQIALPLIFLAGRQLGEWVETGGARRALTWRGAATAGMVVLALLGLAAWIGLTTADTATPLDRQTYMLRLIAVAVMVAACVGGILYLWPRWRPYMAPGVALGLLAIGGAAYFRVSTQVTYVHPDTPSEPLIYVQSSQDVRFTAQQIDKIAQQTGQGTNMPILLDNGWGDGVHESVAWPFEWYLRDYKNRRYFTKTIDSSINLPDYPVILVMAPNVQPIQDDLSSYVGQEYKLNWWFPEDYKQFAVDGPRVPLGPLSFNLPGLSFQWLKDTLSNPQNRVSLVKFLLYREAPNEMGARQYYFYVSKNVPGFGPAPVGSTPAPGTTAFVPSAPAPAPSPAAPAAPASAVAQAQPDGSTIYGLGTDGKPVLSDPKDVAVAPNGRIYVTEGAANRVTMFNPDGSVAGSFGGSGSGDGQFNEPWGISVAPNGNVYVADTWNHRVEYFDLSGKFLGKFGSLGDAKGQVQDQPGGFYGPRAIAISPQGDVYVTDTGNKRIEVFSSTGQFQRAFGGPGSAPGQFQEPVGLALDPDGTLWVADAWNTRIQHLSSTGDVLGSFPVPAGWENQSVTNKPYIAVGSDGNVTATFPDMGQIMTFTPTGSIVDRRQMPSGGTAVGVTIGPSGQMYVADGHAGTVVAYPAQ